MRHTPLNIRAAFLAAGILMASSAAFAQSTAAPQAPMPETVAPDSGVVQIDEKKVDQFAAAFVAVQDIQAQATQQLSNTTDEQQATQVKASAEKQMIAAVEREGLQVEEFNRIADLLTTDLALRSRVVEKVEKRRKG
ncbi:DUF4168 domain-containing protein [Povalibacter sp.]|uniref:DUF4168 domain-containing protein n=1 Tax=Povalibacter sp. TaxID=1962978 RepID=UPI002F3E47A9